MAIIQVLDSHVADLIAAGEVVERPASVVKELVENAIDAGATSVTVEIQGGGMSYIRVTDNGSGMEPEDAATAFLRHATSKIRSAYDLESIGTLGFRGEALAAISAVSRVEVMTRKEEQDFGTAISMEAGTITSQEEIGSPKGTTMLVRDLFFNTPARFKFMKKDTYEGAAVLSVVQHQALAHPEVAFQCIREGKNVLQTPGDGQLKSAVYAVFGRDVALGMTPVQGSNDQGVTVEGFASLPTCCKGSRGTQFFFVNGRYIKSRTMMVALEEAYKNQRMVGKFPACVLHINTRLNSVDVNVHPAKTEVKFVSDESMFRSVYYAVKNTLEAEHQRPIIDVPRSAVEPMKSHDTVTAQQVVMTVPATVQTAEVANSHTGTVPTLVKENATKEVKQGTAVTPPEQGGGESIPKEMETTQQPTEFTFRKPFVSQSGSLRLDDMATKRVAETPMEPTCTVVELSSQPKAASEVETYQATPDTEVETCQTTPEPVEVVPTVAPWKVKGELFNTYVIVEQGDTSYFIDKHAAHERLNFDRLRDQNYKPMAQQLMVPLVMSPSPEESAILLEHQALLGDFGFLCEDFGGDAVIVREVPDYLDMGDVEATLMELLQRLRTTNRLDQQGMRDHVLATMACKAAIKGGQKNDPMELERVAEMVMSGQVKYCPHGRPVALELTKAQLEKLCKRA